MKGEGRTVLQFVRDNTALLALGGAILYAAGFLVTSSYLGRIGVVELEVLRPRYLTVGLLFVGLVSQPLIWLELVANKFGRPGGWVNRLIGVVIAILAPASFESVLGDFISRVGGQGPWPITSTAIIWLGNAVIVLTWFVGRFAVIRLGPMSPLLLPALLLFLVLSYARFVYPLIPRWTGGGLAEPIVLVLTDEARTACAECQALKYLVDEDAHRIVLLPERDGRARVISRNYVIAVIYRDPVP